MECWRKVCDDSSAGQCCVSPRFRTDSSYGPANRRPRARAGEWKARQCSFLPGEARQVVQLRDAAAEIPIVKEEIASRPMTASWLERDGPSGRVIGTPQRSDIDADIREDLVVEFYARADLASDLLSEDVLIRDRL